MEQNKLSFEERVEQDKRARYERTYGIAHPRPPQSKESERLQTARRKIGWEIGKSFDLLAKSTPAPLRLLAVPAMWANNEVLGTDTVMNAIQSGSVESDEDLEFVLRAIAEASRYTPSLINLANRLTGEYQVKHRTLAECYWLRELCICLGLESSELEKALSSVIRVPAEYVEPPIVTRNIDFHQASSSSTRNTAVWRHLNQDKSFKFTVPLLENFGWNEKLVTASTNQYQALEQWLHRLQ